MAAVCVAWCRYDTVQTSEHSYGRSTPVDPIYSVWFQTVVRRNSAGGLRAEDTPEAWSLIRCLGEFLTFYFPPLEISAYKQLLPCFSGTFLIVVTKFFFSVNCHLALWLLLPLEPNGVLPPLPPPFSNFLTARPWKSIIRYWAVSPPSI